MKNNLQVLKNILKRTNPVIHHFFIPLQEISVNASKKLHITIVFAMIITTMVFAVLTMFIYGSIKELRQTIQTKLFISYGASLVLPLFIVMVIIYEIFYPFLRLKDVGKFSLHDFLYVIPYTWCRFLIFSYFGSHNIVLWYCLNNLVQCHMLWNETKCKINEPSTWFKSNLD